MRSPSSISDHSKMHFSTYCFIFFALLTCCACSPRISADHRVIPDFVLRFAPLSHLWSQEKWFPSDIAIHLLHTIPQINFVNISDSVTFHNIQNLGSDVFLTSKDPVEDDPSWMHSTSNKPDRFGFTRAPATIICVEKGSGIIDAFYLQFYSFDEGNTVSSSCPFLNTRSAS